MNNGLNVLVLERGTSPVVAATLGVDIGALEGDDAGEQRAQLLGATFLASDESFSFAHGECSAIACLISAMARSERLSDVLRGIAARVTAVAQSSDEYERRLGIASTLREGAGDPIGRNIGAMLFGKEHPYGPPGSGAAPKWTQIDQFRRRALVPQAATLVVVGDAPPDAVRSEVARAFDRWPGAPRAIAAPTHRGTAHRSTYAMAMCANGGSRQIAVGVAATGPALTQQDAPAFEVLARLLGADLDSALFHTVREDMGIAYTVGASVHWLGDTSLMTMRGSFDGADVLSGTRAMLAAIAAVQEHEPLPDDLNRAKGSALAAWRSKLSTDQGIADELVARVLAGITPADALAWPDLLQAVTPSAVRAAAQRYLVQSAVRIVFVGRPEFVGTASSLELGAPVKTDFYGRELTNP